MNHSEIVAIAAQLRRAADLIDMKPECDHRRRCGTRAEHALLVTKDWSVPLTAELGPRPKGDHGDPTASAGTNPRPDALALEHGHLLAELKAAYRAAADLGGHIIGATTTARIVNERAGIGWCEGCGRYCDGETDATRLRAGKCDACRQRAKRATKGAAA